MSLYGKLTKVCLGLMLALACASVAFAQQTGTTQQEGGPDSMRREGRRAGPGRGRENKMMELMRGLRELNLTNAQQQQARAILERFAESTKPQREALEKLREQFEQGTSAEETSERARQLRGEIRESMQRSRAEINSILTPDQRARLEQMEAENKARHEERRKRFRGQQENQKQ